MKILKIQNQIIFSEDLHLYTFIIKHNDTQRWKLRAIDLLQDNTVTAKFGEKQED